MGIGRREGEGKVACRCDPSGIAVVQHRGARNGADGSAAFLGVCHGIDDDADLVGRGAARIAVAHDAVLTVDDEIELIVKVRREILAGAALYIFQNAVDLGNEDRVAVAANGDRTEACGFGAFEFDEDATGIGKGEEVKRLKGESYNLAGQRVPDSQSYKGIIIENNKKTLNTLKR